MQSIKLIHIGDIHYPQASNIGPTIDLKDEGFNSNFVSNLAPHPFLEVSKSLINCLEHQDIDGILFSGDLTSFGNDIEYKKCVDYFNQLIQSAEAKTGKSYSLHAVPGNHDLKRKNLTSGDISERFKEFEQAWIDSGHQILPTDNIKESSVFNSNCKLNILSLNTCFGCGEEYKRFPQEIADVYKKLVDDADLEDKDQFESYCERIDTPAIHQDHLSKISEIVTNNQDELCFILGHHSLLPQPTVRIELYTEVINGGNARMALSTLNNPVIYCHGHIHDDPVEIVSQPHNDESSLVLISAPEYIKGFNIIETFFTETNYPVGIKITPYRAQTWGGVRRKTDINISLRHPSSMMNFCDSRAVDIYRLLEDEYMRFDDVKKKATSESIIVDDHELEGILQELEWLKVVTISNKDRVSRAWSIGRIGL